MFPHLLAGGTLLHIGIVVPELDAAVKTYTNLLGLGPWIGYQFSSDNVKDLQYRGQPVDYSMDFALTEKTDPQVELIQANGTDTFYHEHIARHGYGIHHLAFKVADAAATSAELVAAGYEVLQSGHGYGCAGDGRFTLFDTLDVFGWILEVLQPPATRREPKYVWPGREAVSRP